MGLQLEEWTWPWDVEVKTSKGGRENTVAVLGWLFSIEYSFADHKRETNGEDKAFKTD